MTTSPFKRKPLSAWLALISLLGQGPAILAAEEAAPAQANLAPVVAVVNGVEITRQELEYLYARTAPPNLPPEVAMARKRAILSELVSTEALAQKAIEAKQDKTPEFEMEMGIARRSALAGKVERELMKTGTKVTPQNAQDYVNTNPRLFAERQLLTLERLEMIKTNAELLDQLDKASDNGASLQRIEKLAQESRAETRRQVFNSYSERLDPQLLKALLSKPYKPVVIKFNDDQTRGMALYVHSAIPAPLTGPQAMQAAGLTLAARQAQMIKQQGALSIVSSAKVNFYGEFAGTQLPAASQGASDIQAAQLFVKPVGLQRKLAIGTALGAAMALLLLTLLTARHYWQGSLASRRSQGSVRRALRGLPLIGRLFGEQSATDELASALASSTSRQGQQASWHGKLLVMTGMTAAVALLGFQTNEAFGRLHDWQSAGAIAAGLLAGSVLSVVYSRTRLSEIGRSRRWLPVSVLGTLLLTVSAVGIGIS